MDMEKLRRQIIEEEGLRNIVYRCPANKLTIGVGRNLEDVGISDDEANYLLSNDLKRVEDELVRNFLFFGDLDECRQRVLMDMCFNMGISRLKKFKNMLAALAKGDYETTSKEMLDSLWARQVKSRATNLSEMMRTGEDLS